MFARYLRAVGGYLAAPLDAAQSAALIPRRLAAREACFLDVLRRAVYPNAAGPYRRLLDHAGAELGDVEAAVLTRGVEGALGELYDAGVHITLEEFKGRVPVERPGLSFTVSASDFDNPLATRHWDARSGGSGGAPRPVLVDMNLTDHDTAYYALFMDAFGGSGRGTAIWYPLPPGVAGMKKVLMALRTGQRVERWFTQTRLRPDAASVRPALLSGGLKAVARRHGHAVPFPRHVAPGDAIEIARWLDGRRRDGAPAVLQVTPSSGVRVCLAAAEQGLDLSGTLFALGGEPLTAAKEAVLEAAGGRAACNYFMAETGLLGIACADPAGPGDVHLALDKLGVLQRPRGVAGSAVDVLVLTTLLPSSPKLMLNVESDDFGPVEERVCRCPLGALGFGLHVHTIRSHEKLSTEGMTFLGRDIVSLVEDVLPTRFGGAATDYQLVESERDGVTRIAIRVSPRVGAVDAAAVVEASLTHLGRGGRPQAMMAELWRAAGTLQVERVEPHVTAASKIPPLQVLRG